MLVRRCLDEVVGKQGCQCFILEGFFPLVPHHRIGLDQQEQQMSRSMHAWGYCCCRSLIARGLQYVRPR